MSRLENMGIRYTLGRAHAVAFPTGRGWYRWQLVTRFEEKIEGYGGIEKTRTKALAVGSEAASEYNVKLGGKRRVYVRKNAKLGSPQNKIRLFSGIA